MPSPLQTTRDVQALGEEYGLDKLLDRAGLTMEELTLACVERVTEYLAIRGTVPEDRDTLLAMEGLWADAFLLGCLHGRGECSE